LSAVNRLTRALKEVRREAKEAARQARIVADSEASNVSVASRSNVVVARNVDSAGSVEVVSSSQDAPIRQRRSSRERAD
jgi:hypothetical protein